MLAFSWTALSEIFQTLHDYNLAEGLHFHSRFDDLDLVLRSLVFQELQIVFFRFLSTVI